MRAKSAVRVIVTLFVAVAASVVLLPTASAQAATTVGPVTINCGALTCSAYLSRSATRAANDKLAAGGGAYAALAGSICGPLGIAAPPVGIACGTAAALHAGFIQQEIGDAATKHGTRGACLKVTFTRPYKGKSTITWWSTNNGNYCKD